MDFQLGNLSLDFLSIADLGVRTDFFLGSSGWLGKACRLEATAEDALAWELCAVDADPSEACLLKRWKDKLLALSLALPLPRKEIRSVGIISEVGAHSVPLKSIHD